MSLPVCYRMVCIIISVLDIAQLPYTSPIYYLVGGLEHLDLFFHILGMSSSQLTNSYFFQRGRYITNQLLLEKYILLLYITLFQLN